MTEISLIILGILFLFIPTVGEAKLDYDEWKSGIRDNKKKDVVLRTGVMIITSGISALYMGKPWLYSFLLSGAIFFAFFDPIMGYLLKRDIWFLGTTSHSDRFLAKMRPWEVILLRGLFFVAAVLLYIKF
jgi:hypothetical protein